MSDGLSTRTVWRELTSLQQKLPEEHRKCFGVLYDELYEWTGGDKDEAWRALEVLQSIGALRFYKAISQDDFITIELKRPLPWLSVEELYNGPEPWGRVESR